MIGLKRSFVTGLLLMAGLMPITCRAGELDIRLFGAKPDGLTLSTPAIQAAIDSVHRTGGGRVLIPRGRYVSGSLVLKDGVELHIQRGGELLGSTNPADYYAISSNRWAALIMADGARNLAISGKGVIDGRGKKLALHIDSLFYAGKLDSSLYQLAEKRPVGHARPQIIQFVQCSDIRVSGVELRNSASWVQTYDLCRNLLIENVQVESTAYWNNDGMDIIDSKNVIIRRCRVNSSDDGICIKSYERRGIQPYCDSILIENCVVRSSASAIKLGTSSYGGFRNVTIRNIRVYDTYRSAIALECWETGTLERILVERIRARNTGNALFIRLSKRDKYAALPMGTLRDVTIRDMKVRVPYYQPDLNYDFRGPAVPFFHNVFPAVIAGMPGADIENLRLEHVRIVYPGRANEAYARMPVWRLPEVPEKIGNYPEFSMFGELPAWAFYVRHVQGLHLTDVRVKLRRPDYRPALVFDDVKELKLDRVEVSGDTKDQTIWIVPLPSGD